MANNNKNFNIPNSTFDKLNTKSDPSQNGSPIPFQAGDFSSSNYEGNSSKSVLEILIFYVLGIGLSIIGYLIFINVPSFKHILNDTVMSIVILGTIILASFIISKIVQVSVTKYISKKRHN